MRSNFIYNFPTGPEYDPDPECHGGMTAEEAYENDLAIKLSRQGGDDGDSGS